MPKSRKIAAINIRPNARASTLYVEHPNLKKDPPDCPVGILSGAVTVMLLMFVLWAGTFQFGLVTFPSQSETVQFRFICSCHERSTSTMHTHFLVKIINR